MAPIELPDPAQAAHLASARLVLHLALQVPASLGATHLPDPGDASHACLAWDEVRGLFVGRPVRGLRAALRPADLTWLLLDDRGRSRAERAAVGATLAQGRAWLAEAVAAHGGPVGALVSGGWPLPGPSGAVLAPLPEAGVDALTQLARWYAVAAAVLGRLRSIEPTASEVRVWPHQADVASLLPLDPPEAGTAARRIGLGLSPGDDAVPEPYLYVTLWPAPAVETLPALRLGRWHTTGWTGAVLPGSEAGSRPDLRGAAFLAEALGIARVVLGAPTRQGTVGD